MSKRTEADQRMTDDEVRQLFRNLHDDLTMRIGEVQSGMQTTTEPYNSILQWLKYILEHIRYQYDLIEDAAFAVRKTRPEIEDLGKRMREFDKHKPTLDFIRSTEMTSVSDVEEREDE